MKKQIPTITFRLAEILKEKGLTQRKAATMTGISKNGISVLAGEPKQISLETIGKICNGLNISPSDLIVLDKPE